MPFDRLDPRSWMDALRRNRQFVAAVAAVLLGITVLAGDPRSPVPAVADFDPGDGPTTVTTVPTDDVAAAPPATGTAPPAAGAAPVPAAPPGDTGPPPPPPPPDPPPPDEPPPVTCDVDEDLGAPAAAEITEQARALQTALGDMAGEPVPGESVVRFVEIAGGCRSGDEFGAFLDVLLEMADLVPDLGLPQIPLPELPRIPPPPLPDEVREALAPLKPVVDPVCEQLGTVALLIVVLGPALNLPFSQGDLIALMDPAVAVCAMFDEVPEPDGPPGEEGS